MAPKVLPREGFRDVTGAASSPEESSTDASTALLGLVAYGELSAFSRLAADAQRAPDLGGRAELATLAAVEMEHYVRVRDHLAGRGVNVLDVMAPFVARVDALMRTVGARDWPEALVATALGRGLVTDLQAEALEGLSGDEATLVREVIDATGHVAFVEARIREACADPQVHARLAMWARRLLGEALAAVVAAFDAHPGLAAVVEGPADGGTVAEGDAAASRAAVLKRLKSRHNKRVSALGL